MVVFYFVVRAPAPPPHQVVSKGCAKPITSWSFWRSLHPSEFAPIRIGAYLTALLFRDGTLRGRQRR